jgi:tetraacyldisaccharide 4'-kinase
VRVDSEVHGPADVGDEPLLLARRAPVIVARERAAGARACVEAGASVIIMDDGLQNPSLLKDFTLALVDGASGIGSGLCLPAGPLRAPLDAQWPLVDAVVLVGRGAPGEPLAQEAAARGKIALRARLEPEPAAAENLRGRRVFAFAGIGRPEKFFETLRECGAELVAARSFPDHHPYSAGEIRALLGDAEKTGALPVTTEKDLVRIAARDAGLALKAMALPVRLGFADEKAIERLMSDALARSRARTT